MKPAFFFIIAIILLPFACIFPGKNKDISGTYVRVLDTELNVLYDTLHFSPLSDQGGDVYQITQRSSTHFKKEEDQGFNKKAGHTLTGIYYAKERTMRTMDPGIIYSFDPKSGTVTINSIRYEKIK